jgi:N-acetylglucosaminyldiphosphoundecaprenol N-acetyl-beta-D-mannosaminyltransferase
MALLGLMYERVLPYAIYIRLHPVRQSELDTARVDTFENGNMTVISCVNAWTLQNIDRLRPAFSEASSRSADIELRLGMTTHVDSAFVAMLMLLYKKQMKSGRQLYLSGVSKNVRKILFWNCAEFLCSDPLARAD